MSLDDFNFGYEADDEDFYDVSAYEKMDLNELNDNDTITGKPIIAYFEQRYEEDRNDKVRIQLLSNDDNGTPINVQIYCNIPNPSHVGKDGTQFVTLFRKQTYFANTYNAIFSILNLKKAKDIFDANGNPCNSLKNIPVKAYFEALGKQDEITIRVVALPPNHKGDVYNTFVIDDIK